MRITVAWGDMPCRLMEIYRRFGWKCYLISLIFCVNGGRMFLRNDIVHLTDYTKLHPRREHIHSQCGGNFKSPFLLIYFSNTQRRFEGWLVGNKKRRGTTRLVPNMGHHFAICFHGLTDTLSQNGCWQGRDLAAWASKHKAGVQTWWSLPIIHHFRRSIFSENLKGIIPQKHRGKWNVMFNWIIRNRVWRYGLETSG
jgi:hypothetical protein